MNKINLLKYIEQDWFVDLKDKFHNKFSKKLKRKFSVGELAKKFGKSTDSISDFLTQKHTLKLGSLLMLCDLAKIDRRELYKNITRIFTGVRKSAFNIKTILVDEKFAAWWGTWLGEGNHTSTHESISMTNYEVNLLQLHIQMLKRFNFPSNRLLVEVITNQEGNKELIKQRWSKILNLPESQITSITYMGNATQEGARVQVWSAGLFRVLHAMDEEVRTIIRKSSRSIKIAYLRGIFAAEGSVRRNQIRIGMKDQKELQFVKEIFSSVGIKTSLSDLNKCNNAYELSIFGYDNIKEFIEIDGFKLHKKRKAKLNRCFKYYENKLPWHVRFERIEKILKEDKIITNCELVNKLKTQYFNTAFMTRKFVREGKLNVDKSEKVLKYSLTS